MKLVNRLKIYIDHKGLSYNAFDKSIEAANGYIGRQIKNNGSIGSDVVEKIFSVYDDLNPNWLLVGDGEMLKQTGNSQSSEEGQASGDQITILVRAIDRLSVSEKINSENVKELIAQGRQQTENITKLVDLLYRNEIILPDKLKQKKGMPEDKSKHTESPGTKSVG